MKQWFKDRFDEPTSWLATAGFLQFIGVIGKIDEAPVVADSVARNAETLASGDYLSAGINIFTGLALALGFGKREKGHK